MLITGGPTLNAGYDDFWGNFQNASHLCGYFLNTLDVSVTAELPGRADAPVESALYFAVSEILTNAAKHASPTHVDVDLWYADGRIRAQVSDDGHGGADPSRGTGLRGIERRLAAFDGVLAVHSPVGGPTTLTLEIPCALS